MIAHVWSCEQTKVASCFWPVLLLVSDVQVFAVHWALVQSRACHLGHVMS